MNQERTSQTLVELAKTGHFESWMDLERLYKPLVYHWCVICNAKQKDIEEISTNVFSTVSIKIRGFEHNGRVGAFRLWMRRIAGAEVGNYYRSIGKQPPPIADIDSFSDKCHHEEDTVEVSLLYRQAVELITSEFSPRDVDIFMRIAQNEERAVDVAEDLAINASNIYRIVSNIKSRIKERFSGEFD